MEAAVKRTNGMLPESMKISKLLLFKERNNFARKNVLSTEAKIKWPFYTCSLSYIKQNRQHSARLARPALHKHFLLQTSKQASNEIFQGTSFLGCQDTCTFEGFSPWMTIACHFGNEFNSTIKKPLLLVAIPDLVNLSFMPGNGIL